MGFEPMTFALLEAIVQVLVKISAFAFFFLKVFRYIFLEYDAFHEKILF